jgi:hypothetical protein
MNEIPTAIADIITKTINIAILPLLTIISYFYLISGAIIIYHRTIE